MIAIAVVAAGAVTLFALPLGVAIRRSYRDEELLRLQRDTVAATRRIDLGTAGRDAVELPPSSDALTVYDLGARRVSGNGPAAGDDLVRSSLRSGRSTSRTAGNALVVAVPLLTRERVSGVVRAARADDGVERSARRAWLALLGLGLGVVGLATLAALLLGRRLAAPLERLARAAGRLGSGDFSARAPRSGVAEVDDVASALDRTAARLDDLVSRERAFSADASHQLRTPLAALRIELEAMELRGDATVELRAALAQVDRLQGTVDTLLSVARDAPRDEARADLVVLVDEAAERWRGPLAAAGRPLRTVIAVRPAVAGVASGVVSEILDVLLDNARRHGGGAVVLTVRDAEGWLAVEVGDEGDGFPGDPEAAFARRSGGAKGHGIGLALARSLAHAEGGRLSVARPGPEPVVQLLLPAEAP